MYDIIMEEYRQRLDDYKHRRVDLLCRGINGKKRADIDARIQMCEDFLAFIKNCKNQMSNDRGQE